MQQPQPCAGAGAHLKCRSCNAYDLRTGEAHRPQLSPSYTLPSTGASQTLGLQLPWASSCLSLFSLLPARPTQPPHRPHSLLDFCKLRCLVQDLTLPSLSPQKPHPPSLYTRGGVASEVRVSSGPHKSLYTRQPHWFGPGDLVGSALNPPLS